MRTNTSLIFSGMPIGFDGRLIEIESDAAVGLPSLQLVGLGSKAVIEARERVRSAVTNSGFSFPARKVTINMAPADLPKAGTHFDLPIALAILAVSGQLLTIDTADIMFAGELSLDGSLRPIKGALHMAELARQNKFSKLIVPIQNCAQAELVEGIEVIGLSSLQEVFRYLKGETNLKTAVDDKKSTIHATSVTFLDDVKGQMQAKRALIIAAAGHHNILLTGPPGSGKSMLTKALRDLLPPLSYDEIIATTKLHSLSARSYDDIITTRPFRAPHHSASRTAILGGGSQPIPGEISLAHHGVLLLDELPEYPRALLESLRQPLEDRTITIGRASGSVTFPADFMLAGTMNPCPCGFFGDPVRECVCSPSIVAQYANRLSGPLLDRIDLVVTVSRVPHELFLSRDSPSSRTEHMAAAAAIAQARTLQSERYGGTEHNSSLPSRAIKRFIPLSSQAEALLLTAAKHLDLSARSYFKVIRVARTIADLDHSPDVTTTHISEALQYRVPAVLQ